MKKILAILLAGILIFALTGCFASQIKKSADELGSAVDGYENGTVNADDLQDAIESYADSIKGNINGFDDINEYVEAIKASDNYTQAVQYNTDNGLNTELKVEGNNLVYVYTYTTSLADNAKKLLEQDLKNNDSMLATNADVIRTEAPCIDKVIWRYYSADGELLASVEK